MTLIAILAAFGGGVFGASLGALAAFSFVGVLVMIGVAVQLGVAPESTDFFALPFGVFGPHVGGFAAGVGAAGYAAWRGKLDSGRSIAVGLMGIDCPDVLLVGGLYGVFGFMLERGLALIPGFGEGLPWTDTVAMTVLISAIVTRILFGKSGLLGEPLPGTTRYHPDPSVMWLPFQSHPLQLATIGLGVGLLAGNLGVIFEGSGAYLAFGIAAASLIFLQMGLNIPVTHHIALPAAIAAAASHSVIWGGIVGMAGALLGEFIARTFHDHGDTHFDPPGTTIAILTLILNGLTAAGFFSMAAIPY
ncbi:permease [Consotaella aegiceratis]|uniref:permease n=1 Tax=Consotaella aegiceratis TaxID=3097961 RepID=UPI002F3FB1DA